MSLGFLQKNLYSLTFTGNKITNPKPWGCGSYRFWLHWWNNPKTLLTYNLIRICQMRINIVQKVVQNFLHKKLYICTIYILSIWKNFLHPLLIWNAWQSCLFKPSEHNSQYEYISSNLTVSNHARIVILIYSTLNSVHRVKSTSSPKPKRKKRNWQQPRFICSDSSFKGPRRIILFNGSTLEALREV